MSINNRITGIVVAVLIGFPIFVFGQADSIKARAKQVIRTKFAINDPTVVFIDPTLSDYPNPKSLLKINQDESLRKGTSGQAITSSGMAFIITTSNTTSSGGGLTPLIFANGANHIIVGTVSFSEKYIFESDKQDPLLFTCDKLNGYVYIGGKGQVTLHDETVITLSKLALGVNQFISELNDKNWLVRWSAAKSLGEMKDSSAVAALIDAMADKDKDVRTSVAWALTNMGQNAVQPLIVLLKDVDKDSDVRINAIAALADLKDSRSVGPLTTALNDRDTAIRQEVAYALGKIGDTRAVEPLINVLKDPNSQVRINAIWALGEIKHNRAVNALKEVVEKDPDSDVRMEAERALKRIQKD